jgi:hypothetical protein
MKKEKRNTSKFDWNTFIAECMFYFGWLFLLRVWIGQFLGEMKFNPFDGALRLIAESTLRYGGKLYKDVLIVYPPGLAFFFSQLPDSITLTARYAVGIGLYALLSAMLISLLQVFQIQFNRWFLLVAWGIATIGLLFVQGDFFSLSLTLISIFILHVLRIQKGETRKLRFLLLGTIALSVWFRWDWPLLLLLLQIGTVIYMYVFEKDRKKLSVVEIRILGSLLAGFLLGALMVLGNAVSHGLLNETWEAAVTIPNLILPYRSLPPPIPFVDTPRLLSLTLYAACGVWSLLLFFAFRKKGTYVERTLVFLPATFFPYAVGRADPVHAIPLLLAVSYVTLILIQRYRMPLQRIGYVLILLSLFPFLRYLTPSSFLPQIGLVEKDFLQEHLDCRVAIQDIKAKSLFIGRTQYDRYIYNNASLYMLRPDLIPATRFISDEPGLQNSCHFGEQILVELQQSSKPMLALLDISAAPNEASERNKSATMKSCGQIEYFLSTQPSIYQGFCISYGVLYEIRSYLPD